MTVPELTSRDRACPSDRLEKQEGVAMPVGLDIAGRPFSEPELLRIAAAFEAATMHRRPPPDFGSLEQ